MIPKWFSDDQTFSSSLCISLAYHLTLLIITYICYYTTATTNLKGGYTSFTLSARLSVCPPWTEWYPLCIFHNNSLIHFIFTHLFNQLQTVYCVNKIFRFICISWWIWWDTWTSAMRAFASSTLQYILVKVWSESRLIDDYTVWNDRSTPCSLAFSAVKVTQPTISGIIPLTSFITCT